MANLFKQIIKQMRVQHYSYKSVQRPNITSNKVKGIKIEKNNNNTHESTLAKQLRAKILSTGPITVAEYMKEVLTNPNVGYYMNHDMFGKEGDFITSPEISQIFGELIAVWIISEWQKIGSPMPFQLVELGPGRGSLARDILRVMTKFLKNVDFSLHMVEISPVLSQIQAQRLCLKNDLVENENSQLSYYRKGETISGKEVFWYKRLEDVPNEFSIVVAHEFFDALPIHKLQLDNDAGVWKEILIDIMDGDGEDEVKFRYVISKAPTPISHFYKPIVSEKRQCLEYSLETERIIGMLAERFERNGGIGLIVDYGHFGEKTDTFRAFRKHELHDPLTEPGTADLTADVDFARMKFIAEQKQQTVCYGPVEQGYFLKKMEGDVRLEQLLKSCSTENKDSILTGYKMLTETKQMGSRFKFFAMFPAILKDHLEKYPVSGFK